MIIGPDYVYITCTKCASQSLVVALVDHYLGQRTEDRHETAIPPEHAGKFTFTCVRNPYSRAVSLWWYAGLRRGDRFGHRARCPDPDDFTTYMEWIAQGGIAGDALCRTMSQQLERVRVDRVLKCETLDLDFYTLPFTRIGEPEAFPRNNRTDNSRHAWPHYMTLAAVQIINDWAADDFARFDYPMLELPPL